MNEIENHARRSLSALVQHLFDHSQDVLNGLTYGDLAYQIGRLNKHGQGHGHGMGKVLGRMGRLLKELEGEWGERIPHMQSLVINKTGANKHLPDDGIKEFWPKYPSFSHQEKVNKVLHEYEAIKSFGSQWNGVLKKLGLQEIGANSAKSSPEDSLRGVYGESPQHKELKKYVMDHPELVGAHQDYEAIIEYVLPSQDSIDVLFRSEDGCIAVEVKSRVSDKRETAFVRGLDQCVKYKAVIEAMIQDPSYDIIGPVRSVLVLETVLPDKYRQVSAILRIEVLERIIADRK